MGDVFELTLAQARFSHIESQPGMKKRICSTQEYVWLFLGEAWLSVSTGPWGKAICGVVVLSGS